MSESDGPKLVRVCAPHFTAGIECANGRCTEAAPILKWCRGKTEDELRAYFAKKGWTASVIDYRTHTVQL